MLAVIAGLLTGCGAGDGAKSMMSADTTVAENGAAPQEYYDAGIAYDNYAMNDMAAEEIAAEKSAKGGDTTANQTQNPEKLTLLEEKLVYHCNLDIETLDYPATMTSVKDTITKYIGLKNF